MFFEQIYDDNDDDECDDDEIDLLLL